MSENVRKKLALLIFVLLFALGGVFIVLYIMAGHSWNYAATEIDDTSGNMQEYLVVVFDGTSVSEKPKLQGTTQGFSSKSMQGTSTNENANVNTNTNANTNASSNASNDSNNSNSPSFRERIQQFFNMDSSSPASDEEKDTVDDNPIMTNDVSSTATLGDAYASYAEKGADVLSLYTPDISHYENGEIFYKGSYTVGVLGLTEIESYKQVQDKIDGLKARGATTIVVLAARASMLAATHGTNVCIEVGGNTQTLQSSASRGLLTVKSSATGTIDAVIMSPNHIVSAKML